MNRFMMGEKRLFAFARGHFFYLLISLLFLLLLQPFFAGSVIGRVILRACLSAVVLAAIYAVSENRRVFTFAVAFALPILAGKWLNHYLLESGFLALVVESGSVLFLAFTAGIILWHVLKDEEVTGDKINGAICVYLLIGITWGLLFSVIDTVRPGSFQMAEAAGARPEDKLGLFIYYSFVTLSTVGYGDILPLSPVARSFAFVEAVVGQMYLATLIARLVGLHIAHSLKKGPR
jgi:hypothetical protein